MQDNLELKLFKERIDPSNPEISCQPHQKKWPLLELLCSKQNLPYIDYALAADLLRKHPLIPECVACFICHLSLASRQGHLAIRIHSNTMEPLPIEVWQAPEESAWPPDTLQQIESLIIEGAGMLPEDLLTDIELTPRPALLTPICKDKSRYYFHKAWTHETQFLQLFLAFLIARPSIGFEMITIQHKAQQLLNEKKLLPEQSEAILKACQNCLTIVCGGPGTGKTYTTAYIIQTLVEGLPQENRESFEILLAAPTGKAAAQLQKSLTKVFDPHAGIKPLTAQTLHSVLEINKPSAFKETSSYLPADLVVVDECSMIDVKMMIKLLASIKPGARLILLGDPFQLPSVEAGGIFSDMIACLDNQPNAKLKPTFLKTCLRAELKGILSLAEWVKSGETTPILELSHPAKQMPGIRFFPLNKAETKQGLQFILEQSTAHHQFEKSHENSHEDMLNLFNRFKILTPLRKGPFGVEHLNRLIHQKLLEKSCEKKRYLTPIMIVNNHKGLNLFNGETGILVAKNKSVNPFAFQPGDYAVFFDNSATTTKTVPAALLPRFELAYCLSIHKSQGSEFDQILLVLPEGGEIFGRKALYTGITRAKKQLDMLCVPAILKEAIERCSNRISGVTERIENKSLIAAIC